MTTQTLLSSSFAKRFELVHLDTSDHRGIEKVAQFDVRNMLLALQHASQFLAALASKSPDAVYLPLARNRLGVLRDLFFLLPSRLARKPVIIHYHSFSFIEYWRSENALMRSLIALALGPRVNVVVLGEALREAFGHLVPAERVHVVPNGIPDLGAGPPARSRGQIILHLSTMWRAKGLFEVLQTAEGVRGRVPEARFVLAGGWYSQTERAEALRFVEENDLASTVNFVGPVEGEEKRRLLQSAAAMILPSKLEGQSLVVVEALSTGTPLVTTPVGCLPETFSDGSEGFLVAEGDVEGLVKRCVLLLTNSAVRGKMGTAARERYEAEFRAERFAGRLGDVVEAVLSKKASDPHRADLSRVVEVE
jgi:glycosyltransferase involved in cell wall biosynthesis